MKRRRTGLSSGWLALVFVGWCVSVAGPAWAHGPTVVISESGLAPELLNLFAGTTVHFTNTIGGAEGVVVADEAGSFTSPPITAAGDGWHFTFEKIGTYTIRVTGRSGKTLRVVVIAKPAG